MAEMKPMRDAVLATLKKAAKLHEAHMDGTEPTSEKSQQKLMDLIYLAIDQVEKPMQRQDQSRMLDSARRR